MRSLMAVLGIFNLTTQNLEGSDDPGRIFVRRLNIRTLISALSLLQLQGCDSMESDVDWSWRLIFCTIAVGFFLMFPWVFPNMFGFEDGAVDVQHDELVQVQPKMLSL